MISSKTFSYLARGAGSLLTVGDGRDSHRSSSVWPVGSLKIGHPMMFRALVVPASVPAFDQAGMS
jgi:hypothetical protein